MNATLTIRDETLTGQATHEWSLDFLTERVTIRELIRSRVYQEVQDYHVRQQSGGNDFRGLVQPTGAEQTLNGYRMPKSRTIDWKVQFEKAVEAFERNQILILVNDRQAGSLDDEIEVGSQTIVSFVRLTLLVGG
ncbi:MAG: hypothetical protein R3C59_08190 [Planctomycetaceae bacterium]